MKPLIMTLGGSTRMPEMKKKKCVAGVVVGKIVKKYRLQRWSETALGFSKKRRTLSDRKAYNRYTDKSLVSKVRAFFSRDDASRMTTGKKQTITKKKMKMQKRFLVDTMKNLHRKFLAENKKYPPSLCDSGHLYPPTTGGKQSVHYRD